MHATHAPTKNKTRWKTAGMVSIVILFSAVVLARVVIGRAQPIIRARVIQTLSDRFKSKVDLATLDVSVFHGLEVSGTGLKIYGAVDPNPCARGIQPLINLRNFHFHTGLRNLFRPSLHVDTVYIAGMDINVPPKQDRQELGNLRKHSASIKVYVDHFVFEHTSLLINTAKAGKQPLEFAIGSLDLQDIGPGLPMKFHAVLVNPKPVGDIQASGLFGPFDELEPRDTPVQGDYSFDHADLGTIRGIGGILTSTGKYAGTLSSIQVDGSTDTPDFRIARSGHAMPLHTDFHAIVDGTNGDTQLKPVRAKLLNSRFTASGSVMKVRNARGHDIRLDVIVEDARIEDFLKLAVRTEPPVITGAIKMKAKLTLPPGELELTDRIQLKASFHVFRAHFPNEKIQSRMDSLSLRTQGRPKEAREGAKESVPADLEGVFHLNDGSMSFSLLHFMIPGAHIDMAGNYSLDGRVFDFRGKARLQAKLSHMTTGWKALVLKPVDPFFSRDGTGAEIPIKISGTASEPHFSLDFRHKSDLKDHTSGRPTPSRR